MHLPIAARFRHPSTQHTTVPLLQTDCLLTTLVGMTACNAQAIKAPSPPPVLAAHFDAVLYKKTQAYSLDKWWVTCFGHGEVYSESCP